MSNYYIFYKDGSFDRAIEGSLSYARALAKYARGVVCIVDDYGNAVPV